MTEYSFQEGDSVWRDDLGPDFTATVTNPEPDEDGEVRLTWHDEDAAFLAWQGVEDRYRMLGWALPHHLHAVEDEPEAVTTTNPKDLVGVTKAPLHLVPSVAIAMEAAAMRDGARKYGPYNWREHAVSATVYVSATERHLRAWLDGEEEAEDSGVHHLAHARACLGILLDAIECGKLSDDRPPKGTMAETLKRLATTTTEET